MPVELASMLRSGTATSLEQRIITKSSEITIMEDGWYLITAIGGGGCGALLPPSVSGHGSAGTGGGAGGLSQARRFIKKGSVLTIVVGAGGPSSNVPGAQGADGGTTTVTGPSISLIAEGGRGGRSQSLPGGTLPGATGGAAMGGDRNVRGGESGSATVVAINGSIALTGGGAVGIYGIGYPSGDAVSLANKTAMTGGAGVGGRSGRAEAITRNAFTSGGSACSASKDLFDVTGSEQLLANDGSYGPGFSQRILLPGGSNCTTTSHPGGGAASNTGGQRYYAGNFGGGGACSESVSPYGYSYPGLGAGSGACVGATAPGGNGCVIIERNVEI